MALYTLKGMRIILIWGASGNYPPCEPSTFSQIRAFLGILPGRWVDFEGFENSRSSNRLVFAKPNSPYSPPRELFFWGASRISAHALRTYIPLSSILFTLFGMWYEVGLCGGIWVFSLVFTRGFGVGKPLNCLCTFY